MPLFLVGLGGLSVPLLVVADNVAGVPYLGDAPPAALLVEDGLAKLDAFTANVDIARTFDERADVAVAFATERAEGVAVSAGAAGRQLGRR